MSVPAVMLLADLSIPGGPYSFGMQQAQNVTWISWTTGRFQDNEKVADIKFCHKQVDQVFASFEYNFL